MKFYSGLLFFFLILLRCSAALSITYYVDARYGNDNWSGTINSPASSDGPWQSIAKVNGFAFQPGDSILFSCGQTWYETLKPISSGTSGNDIFFGSYPKGCEDKPKISGIESVASNNWQRYSANIWKTTFPQNLIINSTFSGSVEGWKKWPADASQAFRTNCPLSLTNCMEFVAGQSQNLSLAISNSFPIIGNRKYRVNLSVYAEGRTKVTLIVRENGNGYQPLGLIKPLGGNNRWQSVQVEFTSNKTLTNARLDIEVSKGNKIYLKNISMREAKSPFSPSMVFFDGQPLTVAHHPNAGYDSSRPDSPYLISAAPSPITFDITGRKVSSQLLAPDLKLPENAVVDTTTKLRIRTTHYQIENFTVTQLANDRITFTPNTAYPLNPAGTGFYFYDDLWMLDSPGEWFFDQDDQTLYLWAPANENPGGKVSLATLDTGVDLAFKSNIEINNIQVEGNVTGVNIRRTVNVTLNSLTIQHSDGSAVFALDAAAPAIVNNSIYRVAISGDPGINAINSKNADIENNVLSESGVFIDNGKRISLPAATHYAGINGGPSSIIANNTLSYIGGIGINAVPENKIEGNVISKTCFNISDCGSIYVGRYSFKIMVHNNLILEAVCDVDGFPGLQPLCNGIYLDDGVSGISVTGNTVKGATNAVHIHNGSNNIISKNILYGASARSIWQQENLSGIGKMTGNIIKENQLFPDKPESSAILNSSIFGYTDQFASYDYNHYSGLYSSAIFIEYNPLTKQKFNFSEWQNAKTNQGKSCNNDLNSQLSAPVAYLAQGMVTGDNVIANGDFSEGIKGWDSWNANLPKSTENLEGCLPISTNCIHIAAGGSNSLVHTPSFSVTKDRLYRVAFDLKADFDNDFVASAIRMAGPTKYGLLVDNYTNIIPAKNWKRYTFIVKTKGSATNPSIYDQGARFDIEHIPANKNIWLANFEIVPYSLGDLGLPVSKLLVNSDDVAQLMDCPTLNNNPALCSSFVLFPEGTAANWPISVSPKSGKIVFSQNFKLQDSDGDGIINSNDKCLNTTKGRPVNSKGCGLNE